MQPGERRAEKSPAERDPLLLELHRNGDGDESEHRSGDQSQTAGLVACSACRRSSARFACRRTRRTSSGTSRSACTTGRIPMTPASPPRSIAPRATTNRPAPAEHHGEEGSGLPGARAESTRWARTEERQPDEGREEQALPPGRRRRARLDAAQRLARRLAAAPTAAHDGEEREHPPSRAERPGGARRRAGRASPRGAHANPGAPGRERRRRSPPPARRRVPPPPPPRSAPSPPRAARDAARERALRAPAPRSRSRNPRATSGQGDAG